MMQAHQINVTIAVGETEERLTMEMTHGSIQMAYEEETWLEVDTPNV